MLQPIHASTCGYESAVPHSRFLDYGPYGPSLGISRIKAKPLRGGLWPALTLLVAAVRKLTAAMTRLSERIGSARFLLQSTIATYRESSALPYVHLRIVDTPQTVFT